jgi:hypothetical protein
MRAPYTSQFKALSTPSGKKAFEAFTAIYNAFGGHVAICAPSLEALKGVWSGLTGHALIEEDVQHVWIVKASEEAPGVAPAQAEVACSVVGCEKFASFIIKKVAYCEEHRKVAR